MPSSRLTLLALQSFPWRLSRGNGLALPHHKENQYTIASALPKPCFFEDFCGPYTKASAKGPYFLTEYSTHQLFSQLTLLQQVRAGQAGWRARAPQMFAGGLHTHVMGANARCTGHWQPPPKGGAGGALALVPQRAHGTHRPPAPVSPTFPPPEHERAPCRLQWDSSLTSCSWADGWWPFGPLLFRAQASPGSFTPFPEPCPQAPLATAPPSSQMTAVTETQHDHSWADTRAARAGPGSTLDGH